MTRRDFLNKTGAALAVAATGQSFADAPQDRFAEMQKAIDAVSPEAYLRYVSYGSDGKSDLRALQDLEASFGRMREEIKATVVADRPAVWHVYNMGTVVKTRETCFAVDFKHRREMEFVPFDHVREVRRLDRTVFVHHIFSKPELLDEIAAMGRSGVSWNYKDLSKLPPGLIARTHEKGVKCCLRACDTPRALAAMRKLGLDYYPTNRMTPERQ